MRTSEITNGLPEDSGFTRVDLMASLAAIVLLVCLVLPALGRVNGKTTIAQCAANLQQYDLALQIYGNENQDNLPSNTAGSWAHDMSTGIATFVTNTGVKPIALYCPGESGAITEQDIPIVFKNSWSMGYVSIGYASTLPATAAFYADPPWYFETNLNTTLSAQRILFSGLGSGTYLPIKPASRVLVADETVTPTGESTDYTVLLYFSWVGSANFGYYRSAHLNGTIPIGGNVGMLDGHVEWRNFKGMQPRAGSSGTPFFYW